MVDDADEVIGAVAGGHVRRFPHLALLHLAVTHEHEGAEVLAQVARREGHAQAGTEAHAQ